MCVRSNGASRGEILFGPEGHDVVTSMRGVQSPSKRNVIEAVIDDTIDAWKQIFQIMGKQYM